MSVKFTTFSRSRRGLTLVEVVAGLALLSTLLVGVLTTKARVTRQWAHAQRRLEAAAAADRLMTSWWRDVERFPRNARGEVPGNSRLAWQTRTIRNDAVEAFGASTVRLEVFDERDAAVLASVEVVLSNDPPAPRVLRAREL